MPATLLHLTSLAAMLGALAYAIGDVLMLNARVNLADYPNLQPHAKLLSDTEKMAALPWWRIMWGGLIGVFATPLYLAGAWQMYLGLQPALGWQLWPPVLLFAFGFILSPFVHGSFIYLGEYVHALNKLTGDSQTVILGMFKRHRQVLAISYGAIMLALLAGSLWFSISVLLGGTGYPVWMAALNPVVLVIVYFIIRRLLPRLIAPVEGAGFSLAYLAFFTLSTIVLW